jgi:hypothetical protein
MALRYQLLLAAILLCAALSANAQDSASGSDADARAILRQSLAASGAANVQAFTAVGTITYFGGGERVEGPATIRANGHEQFRIDADLPSGTRSIALDRRSGTRKDSEGKVSQIPMHNTLSMGSSSFPYLSIAAALDNPAFSISYVSLVEAAGRQFHQISIGRNFPNEDDRDGILARLSRTDYFVDAQTSLVVKTMDLRHPVNTLTEDYVHEIELDAYTAMHGVAVPTVVREKIAGQTVWEFRLTGITFNTNLTDSDFSIN